MDTTHERNRARCAPAARQAAALMVAERYAAARCRARRAYDRAEYTAGDDATREASALFRTADREGRRAIGRVARVLADDLSLTDSRTATLRALAVPA
jgi:hypothetical protein